MVDIFGWFSENVFSPISSFFQSSLVAPPAYVPVQHAIPAPEASPSSWQRQEQARQAVHVAATILPIGGVGHVARIASLPASLGRIAVVGASAAVGASAYAAVNQLVSADRNSAQAEYYRAQADRLRLQMEEYGDESASAEMERLREEYQALLNQQKMVELEQSRFEFEQQQALQPFQSQEQQLELERL